VIPQIGDEDRTSLAPLLDLKVKSKSGELVPVSTFTHIERSTAPRKLSRFQQMNAVKIFGGVNPGVTKEEGLRVLEDAARAAGGPDTILDYGGESRQIRREGSSLVVTLGFALVLIYLVLAAQFRSFRDPLIVLLGSVPLAITGRWCSASSTTRRSTSTRRSGLITLVGLIAKNGILIVQFANTLQSAAREDRRVARGGVDALASGVDDVRGDGVRALAARASSPAGRQGAQSHRHRARHGHGDRHDLHVVRRAVFYSLIAAKHVRWTNEPSPRRSARAAERRAGTGDRMSTQRTFLPLFAGAALVFAFGCHAAGSDYEEPAAKVETAWHAELTAGLTAEKAELDGWWHHFVIRSSTVWSSARPAEVST
jgi:hypothetical protein